ncbi:angiopoietin-2-like [Carcharodon carcharias]|uniref:angiopoietin-2-like n=1 Tax=Carcharodon carcharias TaxID=13397 RepID=UPI001B7E1415|nr:angiopoietin-2-like [Carcharodon carcharias]
MRYINDGAESGLWALLWGASVWVTYGVPQSGSNGHNLVRTGLPPCGQYNNQVQPSRRGRSMASLPQLEGQGCPEMFKCWDQVSHRLQENENGRRQLVELKEMMSQVQEELRSHQHRIQVLELQAKTEHNQRERQRTDGGHAMLQRLTTFQGQAMELGRRQAAREADVGEAGLEEGIQKETTLEGQLQQAMQRSHESSTLLHIHASLIYDLQAQVHNLSTQLEQTHSNSNCSLHHHPDLQYVRNCPIDCASIYYNGVSQSGVYTITPSIGGLPIRVYCDMDTAGGGWIVIQQRIDGTTNFNRSWREYREGFGELSAEFWWGNDHIHDVTNQEEYSLRIDLEDWNYRKKFGMYETFRISGWGIALIWHQFPRIVMQFGVGISYDLGSG